MKKLLLLALVTMMMVWCVEKDSNGHIAINTGYYDALKWVYEHTYGDNYKLQVKDKMKEFIKE